MEDILKVKQKVILQSNKLLICSLFVVIGRANFCFEI